MYTVYQTTCLVNSKFYIGVHKTDDPYDDYLGSGKVLKAAIEKYGRENFKKEILFVFETSEEAFLKEGEIVNEVMIQNTLCYNIKLGGEGGWDYQNDGSEAHRERASKAGLNSSSTRSKELKTTIGKKAMKTRMINDASGMQEIRKSGGNKSLENKVGRYSAESIEKRKLKFKENGHQSGDKNSSYGTIWITNGVINQKIKRDVVIPEGWKKGRMVK